MSAVDHACIGEQPCSSIVSKRDLAASVAGRDGWFFARDSVNEFASFSSLIPVHFDAWRRELQERDKCFAALGSRYFHLWVPDKLSIMQEFAPALEPSGMPDDLAGPLQHFTARNRFEMNYLIDPSGYFLGQKSKYPLYWKTDTRWTPWSCYMAYQLLCGQLNVELNKQLLGYRYDEPEQLMNLNATSLASGRERTRRYRLHLRSRRRHANELACYRERQIAPSDPLLSDGRYAEGSHVVFENRHDEASGLSVVLFGDENSADSRTLLTGMLAETFAEVHFVWNSGVDYAYVERVKPDIVLTQSSELQLTRKPAGQMNFQTLAGESLIRLKSSMPQAFVQFSKTADSALGADRALLRDQAQTMQNHSTRVLLPSEQYCLDVPLMVQPHGNCENPETQMISNDVTLTEVSDANVYFTGPVWRVQTGTGEEVLREKIPEKNSCISLWKPRKRLPGTTLMFATSAGAHCYYHWMLEILPKLGLLEREGISLGSIDHFLVREISSDWQLQTLKRFGIDESRIVETIQQPYMRCERLLHIELNCGINLKMHRFIPQWMQYSYPACSANRSRLKLYITRPANVRRGITNEECFLPKLKEAGFIVMAMEGLSVAEQAALLARTDVLMSPHGGALTNMVFCRPGITVIELFSRHVFPYYYGLAACCGHRYHAILENPEEDYARLVNASVAQSFADTQHETANLSFAAPIDAISRVLVSLTSKL